jgi:predicted ATPase
MIHWLHVKNFRSLRDTRVDFTSPLTAIVGANNTGKTSLVQVFDVLRRLAERQLPEVFQDTYPLDAIRTQGSNGPVQFGVRLGQLAADSVRGFEYRLSIGGGGSTGGLSVEEEELVGLDGQDRRPLVVRRLGSEAWSVFNERTATEEPFHGDFRYHAAFQLRDLVAHKSVLHFRTALGSTWIFDLQPHAMKWPSQIMALPVLEPDGGNLAGVVDVMRTGYPESFEALRHDLGRVVPEIKDVLLRTVNGGRKAIVFREQGLPSEVFSFQASDGILRTLALLAALHSPEKPRVIVVEEPENGIHPRRLELLVDCLRRYAQSSPDGVQRQVIITTHSPYLVDKLRPEEILVATRDDKGTRVEPIADLERVRKLLEDAPLGEIWHRGSIGGVPSP